MPMTEGPWEAQWDGEGFLSDCEVIGKDGTLVARLTVETMGGDARREVESNACAIVQLPKLIDVLEKIGNAKGWDAISSIYRNEALPLLAQIRGE